MKKRITLNKLDASTIIHPEDKSILEKLNGFPGFKKFVDKTISSIMESYASIEYSGEGLNVTSQSLPFIHRQLVEDCRILDMEEVPACSLDWHYAISSFSVGEKNKRMVLQSGTIDLLNQDELDFAIGHELGHMKCGHQTYHMLTECLYIPIQSIPDMKLWTSLIKLPLLNWYRVSDFSADRMGLLCCQDIRVAISTLVKMSGLPKKFHNQIHFDSFIRQAKEFAENSSNIVDNLVKYMSNNTAAMPWLVLRASELLKWYDSGGYDVVINKHYRK